MAKSSFEEILDKRGELIYTNVGDSMYPLIQPRDLLVIKKCDGKLKRYDIPLYKRDNGQYVLHRIVKKQGSKYVMCGDNRTNPEYGITDRHILGVLTDVIREGKTLPVETLQSRSQLRRHYRSIFFYRNIDRLKRRIIK